MKICGLKNCAQNCGQLLNICLALTEHAADAGAWGWRMPTYKAWMKIKGAGAKRKFRNLVQTGKAHGILAFAEDEPMGWCSFGPRQDFPVLANSKAYACDDIADVWSVTCFFIHRSWRRKGLSPRLLKAAVAAMRKRGVKIVEAYPITTTKDGR